MLIIRPIDHNDLAALEQLAQSAAGSTTTLPDNRDYLSELISQTQLALHQPVERAGSESYHFVLQDTAADEIIGIAGIDASVGLRTPFYSYRIDEIVHASTELQIHNRIPALHLCQDYTGCTRLCTLFIRPDRRSPQTLHMLSRARMLFMAQQLHRFGRRTIAELQGMMDENGQSPFWECLGRHFFEMDFDRANYLTGINDKGFIADLMPHYPVYTTLLSEAARRALGQVRPDVEEVLDLLLDEGFRDRGYVDIFDAGPTVECRTDDMRSIYNTRSQACEISESASGNGQWWLVANEQWRDYRCLLLEGDKNGLQLTPPQARQLGLEAGAPMRLLAMDSADLGFV
ncbi:MAG: arginine N-succinyltransferase [Marinobacterium sp.]|nr:arginine N-succinyltransferase [Marinobacterium sp.]